jgi:hypothetical protein
MIGQTREWERNQKQRRELYKRTETRMRLHYQSVPVHTMKAYGEMVV